MKKIIGILLISAMTISLAACGGQGSSEEPAADTQQTETQTADVPETDTPETDAQTPETEAVPATEPAGDAAPADDGQNPVMNIIGDYAADRCLMHIECQGEADALVTISWGSSAAEVSEWTMSGTSNEETMTIEYENGVRADRVYDENGEVTSETIVYENGAGSFVIQDDYSIIWNDFEEHVANGMTFRWAAE